MHGRRSTTAEHPCCGEKKRKETLPRWEGAPVPVVAVRPPCSSCDLESSCDCGGAAVPSPEVPVPPIGAAPFWSPPSAPEVSPSPAAPVSPVAPVATVVLGDRAEGWDVAASWVSFLSTSFLRFGFAPASPPVAAVAAADVVGLPPSACHPPLLCNFSGRERTTLPCDTKSKICGKREAACRAVADKQGPTVTVKDGVQGKGQVS